MSRCLVLRLAGPLQSWGSSSQFNRRETDDRPTKSGVIGLLAAAAGRQRSDPITDLLRLRLGVRVDQPGSLLRDYHTVSDLSGLPLLSATTTAKGMQARTSPKKYTHVTERYYLQDAVFVATVEGDREVLSTLVAALERPAYLLSLGRRSCVPTRPILLSGPDHGLWEGGLDEVLRQVPWQASDHWRRECRGSMSAAATIEDAGSTKTVTDVPISFDPPLRGMTSRSVRHIFIPLGDSGSSAASDGHNPFELLGGR